MTVPKPDPATGSLPAAPALTPDQQQALHDFAAWCLRRAADGRRSKGARIRAAAAADHAREYIRDNS